MRQPKSAGVSRGFSGHDVPSSSAFGFVLGVEIAAPCSLRRLQAGWGMRSGSAMLLPHLIYHAVEQNHYFWPKRSNGMDLCCIKGLPEQFSCPLAFAAQVKRCEGTF